MNAPHRTLLASAIAVALYGLAPGFAIAQGNAQDGEETKKEEIQELEPITVTGTRIKRAGFDTLEPAIVVSEEYIKDRGLTNVADALNEIPGFGVGVPRKVASPASAWRSTSSTASAWAPTAP